MGFRALIGTGVLMTTSLVLGLPQLTARAALRCGEERWAVKTLSDRAARHVDYNARHQNIDYLRHLPRPDIGFDTPRQHPYEFRTYTVHVRLRAFVREDDRDIHLIVSRPHHRHHKMITELPSVRCKGPAGSIKRHAMARAQALDRRLRQSLDFLQETPRHRQDQRGGVLRHPPRADGSGTELHRAPSAAEVPHD